MSLTREPGAGLGYHELQRAGRTGWGWTVLGVLCVLLGALVIAPAIVSLGFLIGYAVSGADVQAALDRVSDTDHLTPAGLAYLNVALAATIPVVLLVSWLIHGLVPGWMVSVCRRVRWRWLLTCFGLAVVALVATLIVSAALPAQDDSAQVSSHVNSFTSTTRDFLLVILFLTPLQAAGEEFVFRGYLTQAFGSLLRRRWCAVLFPALLFALAHGAQDVPVFFDRFAFGLVAGVLVIATGGLEAGIAMHVLNNFLAFGLALAFGDMSVTLNASDGSWWNIPVTLTQSLVYLGLVVWRARRCGVETRTPADVGGADFASARTRL